MPDLPRITIANQTVYDRVVDAFPGATLAEKAESYRKWHNSQLRNYVLHSEVETIHIAKRVEVEAAQTEINDLEI